MSLILINYIKTTQNITFNELEKFVKDNNCDINMIDDFGICALRLCIQLKKYNYLIPYLLKLKCDVNIIFQDTFLSPIIESILYKCPEQSILEIIDHTHNDILNMFYDILGSNNKKNVIDVACNVHYYTCHNLLTKLFDRGCIVTNKNEFDYIYKIEQKSLEKKINTLNLDVDFNKRLNHISKIIIKYL
jgi:hypothetical protein